MGFLKFLKREKREGLDELDLPPAPPPLEGFEENIPLPEFPYIDPDIGTEKISGMEEMPKFDFPKRKQRAPELSQKDIMPDLPPFPEIEEETLNPLTSIRVPPGIPEPATSIQQPISEPGQFSNEGYKFVPSGIYPKIEKRPSIQEKIILREMPRGKAIYVRVDKFKATLGSINLVRSDLRKSEEALMKLENLKSAKDRSFDKFKSLLDDLQKKLIFIDKTLFKGE